MQREEGYYWVKLDDPISPDWHVALWHDNDGGFDGGDWCWRSHHFDGKGRDEMFSEINENRIPAPDEPIVVNRTENSITYKLPKPSDREIEMSAQRAASMAANPFLKTDLGEKYEPSPYAEYKDQLLSLISEKWGVPKEEILKDISESPL